jgi:hypothetical protein
VCSEEQHSLRWSEGGLFAPDHSDAEGERVLGALGGEPPSCIAALEAWDRHVDDLRVLILASRGPGDVLQAGGAERSGWVASTGPRVVFTPGGPMNRAVIHPNPGAPRQRNPRGRPDRTDELWFLQSLGAVLWDRLVASVLHTWTERVREMDVTHPAYPALAAALGGRATLALRAWLGQRYLDVAVEMTLADAPAELSRGPDGVRVRLPFRWLSEVWALGAVVLLGRFVLERLESGPDLERFVTLGPDLAELRQLVVRMEGGGSGTSS